MNEEKLAEMRSTQESDIQDHRTAQGKVWPRGEWTEGVAPGLRAGDGFSFTMHWKGGASAVEIKAHEDLFAASPLLAEVVRRGLSAGVFKGHLKQAAEEAYKAALGQGE